MSRKPRVRYNLSDLTGQKNPSKEDINNILRAADEIIASAGRTMLAKILKGSKDKKVLENGLYQCPSYGYYNMLTIEEITKIIDWMIVNGYLEIYYNGRLPMIVFSERGWETYKPYYVDELYSLVLKVNEIGAENLIERLKQTNRQVVKMLLLKIGESKNIGFIRFLMEWELVEVKKVRIIINHTISKLKSVYI
ncbi:superfamily II DNA helicase RecQ [Clostridium saccharoperbutylacetonicum]|uniref:Superfamily II DNA helicase n=1 Tax=Clostridium saccharoperbutylacetonicum N1-4(HMT) TaxID=931276 RepID=M1MIT5_9CLOT|nr:RQC-minor-1 family DNA-binding protein [Clostridium saccharoperbutylacetonicum]AGF57834.1 superfamily II DNA helicase [Clostridium saccharoperbutylacetonicum N1-4(HMT)]NRT61394.1 superfamily II DNA helicase RecQ [Clostridium saccharoperbutylacetonicum]NSB24712.1 superfamily II DNA helicase RecQ [Clostridium saccharoperbutylacetonicum]NSB44086.1 superfamily II DNA helicase RecQ [Clostridium saccharoperbutylacetonicum]